MDNDKSFLIELRKDFLDEASHLIEQCEESYLKLEEQNNRRDELSKIFRLAHSIKGAGAAVEYHDLSKFAHIVEDFLTILRVKPELINSNIISLLLKTGDLLKTRILSLKNGREEDVWDTSDVSKEIISYTNNLGNQKNQNLDLNIKTENNKLTESSQKTSVKIDTDRIDSVLDIVGEIVVLKSQLKNEISSNQNQKLINIVSQLDKSIRDLQDKSLGMRMTPLKGLFLKLQRIIRDLSLKLNKPIIFEMSGEDTEIDRSMVELLSDPLMHIVRNSLDHGVENLDKRKVNKKSEKGNIKIEAKQVGSRVVLKISDDGNGIDKEKVLKKAKEVGIIKENIELPEQEIFKLIFAPGFSTAEKVTDVSGRGVGMDVVKTNIEQLKGSIEIESKLGFGTVFTITLPLTTSITDGMECKYGVNNFIIPLDKIIELISLKKGDSYRIDSSGSEILSIRDKIIPVFDLAYIFNNKDKCLDNEDQLFIIVDSSHGQIAFKIDSVLGQVQVVLKPVGESLKNIKGIAGAAILGNGNVSLVLDVDNLTSDLKKAS